jgi:hypothetical protein
MFSGIVGGCGRGSLSTAFIEIGPGQALAETDDNVPPLGREPVGQKLRATSPLEWITGDATHSERVRYLVGCMCSGMRELQTELRRTAQVQRSNANVGAAGGRFDSGSQLGNLTCVIEGKRELEGEARRGIACCQHRHGALKRSTGRPGDDDGNAIRSSRRALLGRKRHLVCEARFCGRCPCFSQRG